MIVPYKGKNYTSKEFFRHLCSIQSLTAQYNMLIEGRDLVWDLREQGRDLLCQMYEYAKEQDWAHLTLELFREDWKPTRKLSETTK